MKKIYGDNISEKTCLQGFSSAILQQKRRFSSEKRKATAVADKTKFCYALMLLYFQAEAKQVFGLISKPFFCLNLKHINNLDYNRLYALWRFVKINKITENRLETIAFFYKK